MLSCYVGANGEPREHGHRVLDLRNECDFGLAREPWGSRSPYGHPPVLLPRGAMTPGARDLWRGGTSELLVLDRSLRSLERIPWRLADDARAPSIPKRGLP